MASPILFVGDIHLGRSPHRLAAAGLSTDALGPDEAWRRVVRTCRQGGVQAVVLAGDVVDQDKDRFEAWGHLHAGVQTLVAEGVEVIAVAGNHDHFALPRLADRIDPFRLLGRGGEWERLELDGVDLVGWSFPQRHHRQDPLAAPGLREAVEGLRPGALSIGVLHGDLDTPGSLYAPVRRVDLEGHPLDAWFLGHIHQPHDLTRQRPVGYLGSLVGLDRGETGRRGPWLVTPTSAGTLDVEQLPLGPVYWTELSVNLSQVDLAAPDDALHAEIAASVAGASSEPWLQDGDFQAVGCTVRFEGETDARPAVQSFLRDRGPHELVFERRGLPWAVVRLLDGTRPRRDLAALGELRTPVGALARMLCALERDGVESLPREIREPLRAFGPAPWMADIEEHPLPEDAVVVRAAALDLLEQLLAQEGTA